MNADRLDVRLLGVVEVRRDDRPVALGGPRQRALLTALALSANHPVPVDRLCDCLWGEDPPAGSANAIQVAVAALRRALEPDRSRGTAPRRLVTQAPGYLLRLGPEELDVSRFHAAVESAVAAAAHGDHAEAVARYDEAFRQWREPVLGDVSGLDFAVPTVSRLTEEYLAAKEAWVESVLALGRANDAVLEVEDLVRQHPLRERLRALLMRALYRAGRQADALAVFADARRHLSDELGIDPGPELRDLERQVLAQDEALGPPPTPAAAAAAAARPAVRLLPRPLRPILGRDQEIALASAALTDGGTRLLTLTGAGGTGKSRLALAIATAVAPAYDVVVWVPLAAVADPALVAPAILTTLETDEVVGRDAVVTLAEHLGNRSALLVLDNLEHLPSAALDVSRLLELAPSTLVLATSQCPLHVSAEHELPVPPLAIPAAEHETAVQIAQSPAVAMFVDRARAVNPGFALTAQNATDVAAVCRALDGLPLAIELASARLRVLSPAEMLQRLARRLDVLTGGSRDLPDRQRTMRAALHWSTDLLRPSHRRLLAWLATFAGAFTIDDVERVLPGPDAEPAADDVAAIGNVLDGLAALVENGLVRQGERGGQTVFRLLGVVREFAQGMLAETGELIAARDRHIAWVTAETTPARDVMFGADEVAVFARLDELSDDIRMALAASGSQQADAAEQIVAAVAPYWLARCRFTEAAAAVTRTLRLLGASRPADLVFHAGVLASAQDDFPAAVPLLEEALARSTSPPQRADCLCRLGEIAVLQGELDRADLLVNQVLDMAHGHGLVDAGRWGEYLQGWLAEERGDTARARACLERDLRLARDRGNAIDVALDLVTLAELALLDDRDDDTRQLLAEAVTIPEAEHPQLRCYLGRVQAMVALRAGEPGQAVTHLTAALADARALGRPLERSWCLEGLAAALAAEDRIKSAARVFGLAEALRADAGAALPRIERVLYGPYRQAVAAEVGTRRMERVTAWATRDQLERSVADILLERDAERAS